MTNKSDRGQQLSANPEHSLIEDNPTFAAVLRLARDTAASGNSMAEYFLKLWTCYQSLQMELATVKVDYAMVVTGAESQKPGSGIGGDEEGTQNRNSDSFREWKRCCSEMNNTIKQLAQSLPAEHLSEQQAGLLHALGAQFKEVERAHECSTKAIKAAIVTNVKVLIQGLFKEKRALQKQNWAMYKLSVFSGREDQSSGWKATSTGINTLINSTCPAAAFSHINVSSNADGPDHSGSAFQPTSAAVKGLLDVTDEYGRKVSAAFDNLMGYDDGVASDKVDDSDQPTSSCEGSGDSSDGNLDASRDNFVGHST